MEAETALVGTESGVELHAVSLLDLALALVVLPDNAELDDALGDGVANGRKHRVKVVTR